MKLPAYGRSLWDRRLSGQRPRVVCLLVGNSWKVPNWFLAHFSMPAEIPRLAVKTAPWHQPGTERFDWRLVGGKPIAEACTVLAIDTRGPDELEQGPEAWDSWLWLLAQVQAYARDVWLFTPTLDFVDPPGAFAAERDLAIFSWCCFRDFGAWPPWWPFGNAVLERAA